MKYTLKNRLFMCFATGICFIVFNALDFAVDSGGIPQKEHSGLESPETASKHEKESLSNEFKNFTDFAKEDCVVYRI